MASLADAEEALGSTNAKSNFQRLTRLLMSGGVRLLREKFDSIHPDLPITLSDPVVQTLLRGARLSIPERKCLYPSPGVYGTSSDFDITLTFRLLRTICNLSPPHTGWDNLPNVSDHSLQADLARIKWYRNNIYGHSQNLEIPDAEFKDLWREISEALLRIAASISHEKENNWKTAIKKFLHEPLTPEAERYAEELTLWHLNDMDLRRAILELQMAIERSKPRGLVVNPVEIHDNQQERPAEIDIWNVIMSFQNSFYLFFEYLQNKLNVFVQHFKLGSLLITVECSSLQILEGLWADYSSGHLNKVAQETMVTDEVLKKLGLDEVKLKTFISEKEYEKGKQTFRENSGSVHQPKAKMETKKKSKTAIKVTDEPLADKHRDILKKERELLVKDMDPENILLKMAGTKVFTDDHEEQIKAKGLNRRQQCGQLLDILPRRGDRAYGIFKKALEKDHPHLANQLLKTENEELSLELTRERTNSAILQNRAPGNQTCSRCLDLRKESNALNKEMETLLKKKDNMETKIRNLTIKNDDLNKQIEMSSKEKTEIELQREQFRKELKRNKNLLDAENRKNIKLIRVKNNLKIENYQLQKELKKLRQKLGKLENDEPDPSSSRSSDEFNELIRKCNELEEKVRCYSSLLSKRPTQQDLYDERESHRKILENLKSEGNEERESLEKMIKDKDTKIRELEEANAKLKTDEPPIIKTLQREVETFTTLSGKLGTEKSETESKWKQTRKQLQEEEKKREEAVQREQYLKEAVHHPKNPTKQDLDDERESHRKKLVNPKSEGDKERKTLEKMIEDRDTKIRELEEANAKLKTNEPHIIKTLQGQVETFTKLSGKLGTEKSEIESKWQQTIKQLQEEEKKRKEAVQREQYVKEAVLHPSIFVPSKNSYYSPGVVYALNTPSSATLVATRSSEGKGNASDIFDRQKNTTSGTKEEKDSWWCVDLGQNYLLAMTHYALRHGNKEGEAVLSRWKIEGSTDGIHFIEIKTYEKTDNPPRYRGSDEHAPGRWSVNCEVGAFRYFRIFQTGRNSSLNFGIYLSGVELYGVLFKV